MSTKNELIEVINSTRSGGGNVKSIRKQKYDPNSFYMTLTSGKQVGPVKVQGTPDETTQKFNDAISYLDRATPLKTPSRAAAA